jgi:hypothetical protein
MQDTRRASAKIQLEYLRWRYQQHQQQQQAVAAVVAAAALIQASSLNTLSWHLAATTGCCISYRQQAREKQTQHVQGTTATR